MHGRYQVTFHGVYRILCAVGACPCQQACVATSVCVNAPAWGMNARVAPEAPDEVVLVCDSHRCCRLAVVSQGVVVTAPFEFVDGWWALDAVVAM